MSSKIDEIEKKLEIEAERLDKTIIRQEHRPIRIILNLIKYWNEDKTNPKRSASIKAFVWYLISPTTVLFVSASIISVIGLLIAIEANRLFKRQNEKISIQTDLIKEQTFLTESSRRASLIFELTSILDEIDEELDEYEKSDSIHSLNVKEDYPFQLSRRLEGRIIALSISLRPYRYLNDKGDLTEPLSPERSQLLTSLVASNVNMESITERGDFSKADLRNTNLMDSYFKYINLDGAKLNNANLFNIEFNGAYLRDADLTNAEFSRGNIHGTNFSGSSMQYVNFNSTVTNYCYFENSNLKNAHLSFCDFTEGYFVKANLDSTYLKGANFFNANLTDASMKDAILPDAQMFQNTTISKSTLNGALVDDFNWLDTLKQMNTEGYDIEKITIQKDTVFFNYKYKIRNVPNPFVENLKLYRIKS